MPTLSQRVDRATITAELLPLPKGKKRGRGVGFWGGDPVASVESTGNTAPPFRWVSGKPELVGYQDIRNVYPAGTCATQLAGWWYTPKHEERALVWTRTPDGGFSGVELHPEGWQKSSAAACGDGQQVGHGYLKFAKDPCKGLLWSGSRESMIALTGPDPTIDAYAIGVAQGIQVGRIGSSLRQRACLWHGSSDSYVDMHPEASGLIGSDMMGIGDGQQVGHVWGEDSRQRASLWSGSPGSYVDLAPKDFARSTAWRCARGLQVGWASERDMGMNEHAILWGGSAEDFIDLQQFLPEPWNVSQALGIDVDGDRLRIIGTAQQAVQSNGYEVNAGTRPVMWEMKLLIPEQPAQRESITVQAPVPAAAPATEMSDERKIEKVASDFARAIIEDDYKAARAYFAPWLEKQVTAAKLREILKREFFADLAPVDFVVSANDSTLDELREHYEEYYKNDATRTLASTESFGEWGPPSIYIPEEIMPANFRQWMSIDITPELDNDLGLDYILRLWLIVVDLDGTMKIGYLEPGQ